jgi:uncharacterized protein (DUF1501 family)
MASQHTEPVTAHTSRREILKIGTAMAGALALGALADAPSAAATSPEARTPARAAPPTAAPNVALAPLAVIALSRLAWGPKPGDPITSLEAFNALGANDDARLAAWVAQQLDPAFLGQPDDSDTAMAGAAALLPSLNLTLPQLWATYYTATSPDRTRPARDVRVATLIRAAKSRRQLYEVLVDFWHNHFSLKENANAGTDHGHGSVILLLGKPVKGGKVYGQWPGLANDQLYQRADLAVTTDYRRVLSEWLRVRAGRSDPQLNAIFPNYTQQADIGLVHTPAATPGPSCVIQHQ